MAAGSSSSGTASSVDFRVGFLGVDNVAERIILSSVLSPASIVCCQNGHDISSRLASYGCKLLQTNAEVVQDSDIVIIFLKPETVKLVLTELRPFFMRNTLIVSTALEIKIQDIQEWSEQRRIIRVMPNTPVGQASSVICFGENAAEDDKRRVQEIFSGLGEVWHASEKHFDAISALRFNFHGEKDIGGETSLVKAKAQGYKCSACGEWSSNLHKFYSHLDFSHSKDPLPLPTPIVVSADLSTVPSFTDWVMTAPTVLDRPSRVADARHPPVIDPSRDVPRDPLSARQEGRDPPLSIFGFELSSEWNKFMSRQCFGDEFQRKDPILSFLFSLVGMHNTGLLVGFGALMST